VSIDLLALAAVVFCTSMVFHHLNAVRRQSVERSYILPPSFIYLLLMDFYTLSERKAPPPSEVYQRKQAKESDISSISPPIFSEVRSAKLGLDFQP